MWTVLAPGKAKINMPRGRSSHLYKFIIAAVGVAAALLANIARGPDHRDAFVVKVYDGDTFKIDSGEKIRMIGIDTPEMHESDKLHADARKTGQDVNVIKAQGEAAYEFTNRWIAGQKVHLEFDKDKRDKYGRLLAYVYLPFPRPALSNSPRAGYIVKLDDKKWYFLNATIIQSGYAVPMTIKPNVKHQQEFEILYEQAQKSHLGLWGEQAPVKTKRKKAN